MFLLVFPGDEFSQTEDNIPVCVHISVESRLITVRWVSIRLQWEGGGGVQSVFIFSNFITCCDKSTILYFKDERKVMCLFLDQIKESYSVQNDEIFRLSY